MTLRVLIADHDPAVRASVRRHLASEEDIEVVGEAGEPHDIIFAIADTDPDVILLDPGMPGLDSIASRLDSAFAKKTLVWAVDHHGEMVVAGLRARATGFAFKSAGNIARIAELVRRVHSGEIVIDEEAAAGVAVQLVQTNAELIARNAALLFARETLDRKVMEHSQMYAELEFAREAMGSQVEQLEERNIQLEFAQEALAAQLKELGVTYRATVNALAASVELRDSYTGGHIERVCRYALAMARAMDESLTAEELVFGYMLHDIGKLAVPDIVLLKPGTLTDEEFELVKSHTWEGARYVEGIPFLRQTLPIVRNHHERWDGRGYPDGLTGEEIPLVARVFTLGDTLDAMTTDRPYRLALTLENSIDDFKQSAGTQFDPAVVAVFCEVVQTDDAFAPLRAGVVPGRLKLAEAFAEEPRDAAGSS